MSAERSLAGCAKIQYQPVAAGEAFLNLSCLKKTGPHRCQFLDIQAAVSIGIREAPTVLNAVLRRSFRAEAADRYQLVELIAAGNEWRGRGAGKGANARKAAANTGPGATIGLRSTWSRALSIDRPHLDVGARRILQWLQLTIARLPRRDPSAALAVHPTAPGGPPGARLLFCTSQPFLGRARALFVGPMAVFIGLGRIDHPCNVLKPPTRSV